MDPDDGIITFRIECLTMCAIDPDMSVYQRPGNSLRTVDADQHKLLDLEGGSFWSRQANGNHRRSLGVAMGAAFVG